MDETSIYKYRLLAEGLVTSGQPTEDELGFIVAAGYDTVINLGLSDAGYSVSNEASFFKTNHITYIHIPVIFDEPRSEDLDRFMQVLEQHKDSKLLIHCAANKRVSAFIALYRILSLDWSYTKAMKELKAVWQPDSIWQAFIKNQLSTRLSAPAKK